MTLEPLRPWSQVVRLQSDVEAGQTATAIYAIDLGALVAGDPHVPHLYRRSRDFFAATHLTSGLRRLLNEVLGGLAGGSGDRVLQLRSPFGGGKSHTLAALYHAAQDRSALNILPEGANLPDPGPVKVAVFDGEKFDVTGTTLNEQRIQTIWGSLAAQLGCYDLVAAHDRNYIAPGGDIVAQMIQRSRDPEARPTPILLLFDEVLKYLERAGAMQIGDSTLGRQTQDFLQTLSVEVAGTRHVVLVYSLQASTREAYGNEPLLDMLDHLTSRVDAKREPVSGDEILPVLKRRLLAEPPDTFVAQTVAGVYAEQVTRSRVAHAADDSTRREAEDDRLALQDRIVAAYPFHPALIDVMRERWASLPHFQRTRGALRFLSICLHALKRDNQAGILLGPGDVLIADPDVAQAFFTEVGQREPFKAVLERDFLGSNARIPRIDERLARENPLLSSVRPALRIATAILMYSFGGLSRPGDEGGEAIASGITESELLRAVVGPDLDSITMQAVLQSLRESCLYLHYDGARYVFKTTPNITQVLEQEAERINREEVEQAIQEELDSRLRGRLGAILWAKDSLQIPDREPRFLLAYLPLDFSIQSESDQETQASRYFRLRGDVPRHFRNGLGLAIPDRNQVGPIRRAMRYLKAVEHVRTKHKALNMTIAQMDQLKDREKTEKIAFESAIRNLYQSIWLPDAIEGERVRIEKVNLAGRPLQATGIHERLTELLSISPPRLFASITPDKILELMRLGVGPNSPLGVSTGQIVEAFFQILGFPRLESEAVLRRAIVLGIQEGVFGYVARSSQVDVTRVHEGAAYMVDPSLVRMGVSLQADEIDLASAIIILPQAIALEVAPPALTEPETHTGHADVGASSVTGVAGSMPVPPAPTQSQITYPTRQTQPGAQSFVRLSMRLTRQQLYATWDAFKNLAEKAGVIQVTVEANKPEGFDPSWLRNAVLEPLDEADVDVEEG